MFKRAFVILAITMAFVLNAQATPTEDQLLKINDPVAKGHIEAVHKLAVLSATTPLPATAIPQVIPLLKDEFYYVRVDATYILRDIGPAALPALQVALQDAHYYPPIYAARTIAMLGRKATNRELALQLITNAGLPGPDNEQQTAAARALAGMNLPSLNLKAEITTAYNACQLDAVKSVLNDAMIKSGPLDQATMEKMVDLMDNETSYRDSLQQMGKTAVPALIARMGKVNKTVDWAIIECLGNIGPTAAAAVPMLANALANPRDVWFANLTADALGKIGVATPEVKAALEKAQANPGSAQAATDVLAKLFGGK